MRWPFPLAPQADELLSSYLVRAAHRYGLTPYRFCAFHFPGVPVWNRDIDRSASDALLAAIAEKAELPVARVIQMTLRSTQARLGQCATAGTARGINTVGVYHRMRRRWGLQYCPECLEEHPVFLQSWRLSFMVACRRHQTLLQDACPHCDAPLAIHRQALSPHLCHRCSRSLTRTRSSQSLPLQDLLDAQSRYELCLSLDQCKVGSEIVYCRDLIGGVRVLTGLAQPMRSAGRSRPRQPSMEQARVTDRACRLLRVESLLANWPQEFATTAAEHHLTQRSFMHLTLPAWLMQAVDSLPAGRMRLSLRPKRHSLRAKLARMRGVASDWRTARAELLWRAATR